MKNKYGRRSVLRVTTELGTKPSTCTTWELKSLYAIGILNKLTKTQKSGLRSMRFNDSLNHNIKLFKSMIVNSKKAYVAFFKYLDNKKILHILCL